MELLGMDRKTDTEIKRVPLKDFITQHRQQWVLHASIGDIILKRIRYLDSEDLSLWLLGAVEGYAEALKKASVLQEKLKYDDALTPEDMVELQAIATFLKPYTRLYFFHCFVEPHVTSPEDFDALLGALTSQERVILLNALGVLTNPDIGEVSVGGLSIVESNNIPIANDLNMENITMQQASVLMQKSDREQKNLRELFNGR